MEILDDHFDAALATYALVEKLKKAEGEYKDYAVEYNLDNVQAMLENLDFDFEYRVQKAKGEGDEDLPAIDINCKIKGEFEVKTLLTIRAKRGEGTYYRNIFEKKALFTDLFATILKATDR